MSNQKLYYEKAVTAGMIGFFLLILAFIIVAEFYPLRAYISKSVSTAICFIVGFIPPYLYVRYRDRHRDKTLP
jgi:hypothetical protein